MGYGGREREQGFMLLGLIVAIFLILLVLGVAAPRVARELRREREVETVHRGNQYVRAIQVYYRKFGHYPGSMEQLEKTNNIRFLRKQYVDPLTGKADWRLIKVGEAKTTVKGFFGKPLTGLAPGLGAVAGMASGGGIGAGAAGSAGAGGSAFGSSGPSSVFGGPSSSGSAFGGTGSSPTSGLGSSGLGSSSGSSATSAAGSTSGSDSSGFGSNSGMGSQSATTFTGGGAPFEGVGLVKPGDSIITLNEQTTYPTWEFIYDPRIEQLKAAAALQGGGANGLGVGGSSGSSFGSGSSSGFGSSSGSGFGNSSGTAFGNSSGSSGFGSSSPPNSSSPSSSSSPTGSGSSFP